MRGKKPKTFDKSNSLCLYHGSITLPASKHTAWERLISLFETVVPPVVVYYLKRSHIQSLLRLIQGQDIDGEECVFLALILVFPITPAVDPALVTEVLVDIL